MKLKDYVLQNIYNYPTLFLAETYEESRLLVLHQCFLVLGNGVEWAHTKNLSNGGYIVYPKYRKFNDDWVRVYDKQYGKEKFDFDFNDLIGHGITEFLEPYDHDYHEKRSPELKKIINESKQKSILNGKFFNKIESAPYPFSAEHWPFQEIKSGAVKLSDLKPDWREGMVDIFNWALEFFTDTQKYCADEYFTPPGSGFKESIEKSEYSKNWKKILNAYEVEKECADVQEFDFENFAAIISEKNRLKYVSDLEDALNFLK